MEFQLFLPAFLAKRPEEHYKFLMLTPNACKIYFYLPALAVLLLLSKSLTNASGDAPEKIDTQEIGCCHPYRLLTNSSRALRVVDGDVNKFAFGNFYGIAIVL